MPVDGRDALVGAWFEELGCNDLFDSENHAVLAPDADGGPAVLDRLHGVLDLEVAAIGRENGVGEVVACAYRRLWKLRQRGVVSLDLSLELLGEVKMGGWCENIPLWLQT
jgi:hypothetical protein